MQLTTELAQPIVERAMAILQRNVNIMDADGIIVASGDTTRVGSVHAGAVAVVRTGRRLEIHPEDLPNWDGVRLGVNLPLRLNGRIVGVVGITGPPDEVRPFGELIREMVQLMLSQARSAELERTMALAREALLRELLTGSGELSDRLVREAALLGLDAATPYAVLLCELSPGAEPSAVLAERFMADAGIAPCVMAGPWEGRLVVVAGAAAASLAEPLQRSLPPGSAVAVGRTERGIAGLRSSFRTALATLDAGRRLHGAGAFAADDFHLEMVLATVPAADAHDYVSRVLGGLPPGTARAGAVLRQTLRSFFRSNLSVSGAADALGVHRHTLVYRLDQVADATGFDPRTSDGAVRLYLALLLERLIGQNVEFAADREP